jgi:lysophospholipase L1-like esterase
MLLCAFVPAAQADDERIASRCAAPGDALAEPAPLPHVAAALKSNRKTLNILTVDSPLGTRRGARKSNSQQLEALLEKALPGIDVIMIDRPMSGQTVATAAERIRTEVALKRPDLVIWMVGANDALARTPAGQFEDELRDGVRWLKKNGVDVALVGFETNPWLHDDREAAAYRAATAKVAKEENVFFLRRYEAMLALARVRGRVDQGDEPFPAALGYDCVAEQLAQALAASLAPRRSRPTPTEP